MHPAENRTTGIDRAPAQPGIVQLAVHQQTAAAEAATADLLLLIEGIQLSQGCRYFFSEDPVHFGIGNQGQARKTLKRAQESFDCFAYV